MRRKDILVLGIVGSARKEGNCASLLREVLDRLRDGFDTETVFLSDLDIRPCEGCHYCQNNGSCRIDDDMPALSGKLSRAGAIVLATPSYMGGVTSRMRALMERTWPLRKGQMADKIGGYIVTGRRRIGIASAAMAEYFTRLGMIQAPGVLGYAYEPGEIAGDREAVSQALRLARDLRRYLALMEDRRTPTAMHDGRAAPSLDEPSGAAGPEATGAERAAAPPAQGQGAGGPDAPPPAEPSRRLEAPDEETALS